jgi:hypothetical protein
MIGDTMQPANATHASARTNIIEVVRSIAGAPQIAAGVDVGPFGAILLPWYLREEQQLDFHWVRRSPP